MSLADDLVAARQYAREAEREARPTLATLGLNPAEFEVLYRIDGGTTQADLQILMGCSKANLSEMLDGLERRRLVRRTVEPLDHRHRNLTLTPEARVVVADAIDSLNGVP